MKRKKKRNYRAEYKRRIQRALAKGYNRHIARGHARKRKVVGGKVVKRGELGLKAAKFLNVMVGADPDELIALDARHVFGRKPKRKDEDFNESAYQMRLEELAKRDGHFDWLSEGKFIQQMKALGLTEREAYSAWFSP